MASGTIVKNVVEYIVNQIVEDTKSVKVDVADSDDENVTIEVRTSPDDMGRVIGKRGRVARAIRIKTKVIIQKRTIIFGSAIPFSS